MSASSYPLRRSPLWAVIKDARGRQRRRRRRTAVIVGAALVAVVVVRTSAVPAPSGPPARAGASDTGRWVTIGGEVRDAAVANGRVWTLTCVRDCASAGADQEHLVEVNAASGHVVRRFASADAVAVAPDGRAIWIAHFATGAITRLDPSTGRITASVRLRLPAPVVRHDRAFLPVGLSYAESKVWVSTARGWIAEINDSTGKVVAMVRSPSEATSTTTDRDGTWVAEDLDGVGVLSAQRRRLTIRPVPWEGQPVAVSSVIEGGGLIWATGGVQGPAYGPSVATIVTMIDPRSGRIVHQEPVPAAQGAVYAADALYLGDLAHGRVYRLAINGTLRAFAAPAGAATLAAATRGELWATTATPPGRLLTLPLSRLTPTRAPRHSAPILPDTQAHPD
jgi:sugar lactone lactonase YvrE